MTGTMVNTVAVITGALLGTVFQRAIPEKFKVTVMQGIGLSVLLIGLQMALQTKNPLIVVVSLVLGGITGEAFDIEERLGRFGQWLEGKVGSNHGDVAKAFVTASLIYCVGAMAIMGSLQDGLTGDSSVLFVKSILDGVSAVVFASTMGIGVAFSALPVFVYQGTITLAASFLQPYLQPEMIQEMTATGGLLIMGIGLNVLGITQIRVGNLLPGIVFAMIGARFIQPF